jgi:outer membrane protein OmpA-like peptidoglycan-associated protein
MGLQTAFAKKAPAPKTQTAGKVTVKSRPGMPMFLRQVRESVNHSHEHEAHSAADSISHHADTNIIQRSISSGSARGSSPLGQAVNKAVSATRGGGQALPTATRAQMENNFGNDFSNVRIHDDSQSHHLAQSLGANAFTTGSDIYFNEGRYSDRLLAHELTHVVQQGGEAGGNVQFDLMMSLPTALGGFEIDMATRAAPRPGLDGHIRFFPDPSGPYSAQIGLIQAVNVTDVGGRTTPTAGDPADWRNIGTGGEAGRMETMTTGNSTAPQGWFIDSLMANSPQATSIDPNYIEHAGISEPDNQYGWLRSPTDWREASLYDYPWMSFDTNFDFETVAKATDTQAVYGALYWGFEIRSGAAQNEYVQAADAQSAVFDEALERYRGYFAHEAVVLYFDTNQDIPEPGEDAKLADVADYLNRYSDTMIMIDGYADERGRIGDNDLLAQRRAESVENLCLLAGIPLSRIDYAVGWGETTQFSPHGGADAGSWRANRRVVISFRRTASGVPIDVP